MVESRGNEGHRTSGVNPCRRCDRRSAAKKVRAAYFVDTSFSIFKTSVYAEVSKSGDLGFTDGTYEASYKGPYGKTVKEKGKYVFNWKMQADGNWKAIHDIWNTDAK